MRKLKLHVYCDNCSFRTSPEGVAYRDQLLAMADALMAVAKAPPPVPPSDVASGPAPAESSGSGFVLLQLLDVLLPELTKMGRQLEPRAAGGTTFWMPQMRAAFDQPPVRQRGGQRHIGRKRS